MFGLSDEVIVDLRAVFRQYPNVQEVLIFGSRMKGDYRNGSDIDLAIKGDIQPSATLWIFLAI